MGFGSFAKMFVGRKQIYPKNDLISSYNMDQGSLFKVTLSAFKQAEANLSKKNGAVSITTNKNSQHITSFEVIHNADSLNISHNHVYGDNTAGLNGLVGNIFKNGGTGNSAVKYASMAKGMMDLVTEDKDNSAPFTDNYNTFANMDIAKIYKKSTAPSFTTSFSLIASNNPLVEVIYPALLFTFLSYPTLNAKKTLKNFTSLMSPSSGKSVLHNITDTAIKSIGVKGDEKKKIEKTAKKIFKTINSASKAIDHVALGKWRYRIGDAPPFWIVSSSNGIIYMPYALLQSVDVKYYGPWVANESPRTLMNFVHQNIRKTSGLTSIIEPGKIFPNTSVLSEDPWINFKHSGISGLPSYATVTLTFIPAFDQMFGEEWLTSIYGAGSHMHATSRITETN